MDEGEQLQTSHPNIICSVIVTRIITRMLNLRPRCSCRMNKQVQQKLHVFINLSKCQRDFTSVLTADTNQPSAPRLNVLLYAQRFIMTFRLQTVTEAFGRFLCFLPTCPWFKHKQGRVDVVVYHTPNDSQGFKV